MRTAIEIIGTGILIKELEAIKIWIEIKLLLEIKWTRKKYSSVALLKLDDFRREYRRRNNIPAPRKTLDRRLEESFRFVSRP